MILAGEQPVEESGAGAADVEIAGGRGRKAHAYGQWELVSRHGLWLSVCGCENFSVAEAGAVRPTEPLEMERRSVRLRFGNDTEKQACAAFQLHVVFVKVEGNIAFWR